jgi:spermidine synthase
VKTFQRPLILLATSALTSGAAALGFEILWSRELGLVFGSSGPAVATTLAAFMLGLGVGSEAGGRLAERVRRPWLAVALLEGLAAVTSVALSIGLLKLPTVAARLLPAVADQASPMFVVSRFVLAVGMLTLPAALMGAGFPLLVRAAAADVSRMHRAIAALYGANVLGGVAGALMVPFVALPRWGVLTAVAICAGAQVVAAVTAAASGLGRTTEQARPERGSPSPTPRWALAAAMLSGALVLGAETVWYRALHIVLSNTTMSFAMLVALTLLGLAVGGFACAPRLIARDPRTNWARLQIGAAVVIGLQAACLPSIATLARMARPDAGWARVVLPPTIVGGSLILPAAILMGAAWPLLVAAATPRVAGSGRRIGSLGLVNAIGASVGGALTGIALLPALGFGRCLLFLASGHLAATAIGSRTRKPLRWAVAAAVATGSLLAPRFARVPLPSMTTAMAETSRRVISYVEGPTATVVVTEYPQLGVRDLTVDNNAVIGTTYDALKVARMLGVLPVVLHPDPRQVLVIGFGVGVTTASALGDPRIEHAAVVEISPEVVDAAHWFRDVNLDVLADPRVELFRNDGRNHLLLTDHIFDVITCDPVHPLLGSAPLYTREFYRLCRRHLAPGGVVAQYLPLHRMPPGALRTAVATFRSELPHTRVAFGLGHAVMLGSNRPMPLDWDGWRDRLARNTARDSLARSALEAPGQIAALLVLDDAASARFGSAMIASDLMPRLEFLEPAAFEPGLWQNNARLLLKFYTSPVDELAGLSTATHAALERLIAGKRLLLFAQLDRDAGRLVQAQRWLEQALEIAGADPEVQMLATQARREGWLTGSGE